MDEIAAVILQRRMENVVQSISHLHEAGSQAYRSFLRAYATHSSDTKGIFNIKSLHLGA
jgi:ATP-dependent RNA helicase DDX31/DBP7